MNRTKLIGLLATLLILLLGGLAAFAAGVKTGKDLKQAEFDKDEAARTQAQAAALDAAAARIVTLGVKHVTINRRLEKETHEKIVYRDCQHSADGLSLLNQALRGPAAGAIDVPGDAGGTP